MMKDGVQDVLVPTPAALTASGTVGGEVKRRTIVQDRVPQQSPRNASGRSAMFVVALVVVGFCFLVVVAGLVFLVPRPPGSTTPAPPARATPTLQPTITQGSTPTPTEPAATDHEVIIPDTTKVLSGDTVDNLESISDDGAVYTFAATGPDLEAISQGDVIVGDTSSKVPDGFLRRVTNVARDGAKVMLETEPARLEDAIDTGSLQLETILAPEDVRQGSSLPGVGLASLAPVYGPAPFVVTLDDVVLVDLDGNEATKEDQVRANGMLSFEPNLDFGFKMKGFQIQEISVVAGATERVSLQIEGDLAVSFVDLGQEVDIARYYFQPITVWVGWVPVVFAPVLDVRVGLNGTATVSFHAGVTQEASVRAGLSYNRGNWIPISELSNEFTDSPPRLSANVQIRGYAGLQFGLLIYGVGGPQSGIDGFLKLGW